MDTDTVRLDTLRESLRLEIGGVRDRLNSHLETVAGLPQAVTDLRRDMAKQGEDLRRLDSLQSLASTAVSETKSLRGEFEALDARLRAREIEAATIATVFGRYIPWVLSAVAGAWLLLEKIRG